MQCYVTKRTHFTNLRTTYIQTLPNPWFLYGVFFLVQFFQLIHPYSAINLTQVIILRWYNLYSWIKIYVCISAGSIDSAIVYVWNKINFRWGPLSIQTRCGFHAHSQNLLLNTTFVLFSFNHFHSHFFTREGCRNSKHRSIQKTSWFSAH